MTVFPHREDSIGLPGVGEWQAVPAHPRHRPRPLPRHFRALTGFPRELSRLPRMPTLPPLDWDAARQYLAAHAAAP